MDVNKQPSSQSGSQPPTPGKRISEYRLKTTLSPKEFHVMKVNASKFDLTSLQPPVRMYRQGLDLMDEDLLGPQAQDQNDSNTAPYGRQKKAQIFRKKTVVLSVDERKASEEQSRHTLPWVLEDAEGQNGYVGRLEGGMRSNYVLFVMQGQEFKVIPAQKWYSFTQKIQYQTLSLEEAENKVRRFCFILHSISLILPIAFFSQVDDGSLDDAHSERRKGRRRIRIR